MGLLKKGRPKKEQEEPDESQLPDLPELPTKFKERYGREEEIEDFQSQNSNIKQSKKAWVAVQIPTHYKTKFVNQATKEEIEINNTQDIVDLLNSLEE